MDGAAVGGQGCGAVGVVAGSCSVQGGCDLVNKATLCQTVRKWPYCTKALVFVFCRFDMYSIIYCRYTVDILCSIVLL